MMDWLASVPHLLLQLARVVAIVLGFLVPYLAVVWWLNRRDRRQRQLARGLRRTSRLHPDRNQPLPRKRSHPARRRESLREPGLDLAPRKHHRGASTVRQLRF